MNPEPKKCRHCLGDDICTNANSPYCCDYCPVTESPEICKYMEAVQQKAVTKVFISQPMNGRKNAEIEQERKTIMNIIRKEFPNAVEIDSFFKDAPHGAAPLWYLGEAIKKLSNADVAVFAPGWEAARGCSIEQKCAMLYGVNTRYILGGSVDHTIVRTSKARMCPVCGGSPELVLTRLNGRVFAAIECPECGAKANQNRSGQIPYADWNGGKVK